MFSDQLENRIDTLWSNEAIRESLVCAICCIEFPDYFTTWYKPEYFNWIRCGHLLKDCCADQILVWKNDYVYHSLLDSTRDERKKLYAVKSEVGEALIIAQAIRSADVDWLTDVNWGIASYCVKEDPA